mmetsp:Transcript_27583/g.77277  ORF Transcript_27583/g.77277 Transcript_27583/m.77277 type:complete len:585 (+) Transcript_27583:228-1982(+)|eukprot:CAMPEP_0119561204 /NCGR_PEP_ID=MMETSP1352-20130426/16979_1 /TAXON_ID=265584 /ORGANISM="Stauroneis constricta, Strain CCMP1120" /LENGTH=584 /DNA_ID=CAMNT_0007609365 /DNA_START=105 /DNA_END=1859 /DNA_ORIENTATION=+
MAFNVSENAAYTVLFVTLVVFTLLAIGSADFMSPYVPQTVASLFCLSQPKVSGDGRSMATSGIDYFLAARNSAGVWAIAVSYFASGMGAWVVYGTTEMGANPQLSWLGVLGYSGASSFPAIIMSLLGPKIRRESQNHYAFSTTDFGRQRYGRVMQVSIACISGFYMFIFIVAELTSISNVYALLTANSDSAFGILVTVILGIFTVSYTGIGGLPASIVTDKFQGFIMFFLVVLLTVAVSSYDENHVNSSQFSKSADITTEGLMAAITLFLAIASAEMFNQSTWQRVWAAKDEPTLRHGFCLGFFLVFLLMMFFGIMGMLAYANDPESYDNFEKFAFLAFFDILAPLPGGWHVMVLILVTALAASSVDSLQNGLTSIFYHDLVQIGWNPVWIARCLVVALNVPAIYLASKKFDVIALFLVADLVCATAVFPTFLGLQRSDLLGGMLPAPTELGAFLGILSGIGTVIVNGIVNDVDGGLFQYFWLENGGICALCGSKTMVSFIVTPAMSALMTYVFSFIDIMARGDRARKPLFLLDFDKDDYGTAADNNSIDGEGSQNDFEGDGDDDYASSMKLESGRRDRDRIRS